MEIGPRILDNDDNPIELETKESSKDSSKSYILMGFNSQMEVVDRTVQAIAKADGSLRVLWSSRWNLWSKVFIRKYRSK